MFFFRENGRRNHFRMYFNRLKLHDYVYYTYHYTTRQSYVQVFFHSKILHTYLHRYLQVIIMSVQSFQQFLLFFRVLFGKDVEKSSTKQTKSLKCTNNYQCYDAMLFTGWMKIQNTLPHRCCIVLVYSVIVSYLCVYNFGRFKMNSYEIRPYAFDILYYYNW